MKAYGVARSVLGSVPRSVLGSVLCLALAACGDGTTGRDPGNPDIPNPPNPLPVKHTLAQSQSVTIPAGSTYGFAFTLPVSAYVNFSASETTTDKWDVAVFSAAQWAAYLNGTGNTAQGGIHSGVMQVADGLTLPAGTWYLGFRCVNAFQRCMFVFSADATY